MAQRAAASSSKTSFICFWNVSTNQTTGLRLWVQTRGSVATHIQNVIVWRKVVLIHKGETPPFGGKCVSRHEMEQLNSSMVENNTKHNYSNAFVLYLSISMLYCLKQYFLLLNTTTPLYIRGEYCTIYCTAFIISYNSQ